MCALGRSVVMTDELSSPDGSDEFPSEEELPDDPVTVGDVDLFTVDDDDFAIAKWKSQRER